MEVTIHFFGPLIDITGRRTMTLKDVHDTEGVKRYLHRRYPALAEASYLLAVDKEFTNENIFLQNDQTIALLPPFAGG